MAQRQQRTRTPYVTKKGTFTCEKCEFSTPFHSFGKKCSFSSSLTFLDEAYIARDPFNQYPKPLLLGSHCAACKRVVCVSPHCSIFYTKRFCVDCVRENWEEFPKEIQQEVLKTSKESDS